MDVLKFAKQQGFVGVRRLEPWRGFDCYEALTTKDEDELPAVGFPQIILVNEDVMRMAQYDEALAYLDENMED